MSLVGDIWNGVISSAALAYDISKDQHLTGAQKEANQFTHSENALARDFNAEQARQQMEFQERMANTQYQRGVADMQAAGVNPALAYSQGGNVAPSGAAGSSSGASSVDPGRGMTMSDILSALRYRKEIALLDKQTKLTESQAKDTEASAELKKAQTSQALEDTESQKIANEIAREYGMKQADANLQQSVQTLDLIKQQRQVHFERTHKEHASQFHQSAA